MVPLGGLLRANRNNLDLYYTLNTRTALVNIYDYGLWPVIWQTLAFYLSLCYSMAFMRSSLLQQYSMNVVDKQVDRQINNDCYHNRVAAGNRVYPRISSTKTGGGNYFDCGGKISLLNADN
ncbi:hypothetical protein GQX74_003461 [Glossina fuscipes]|nr:hypothetical protein GQX74_003461 [Glossina fuscipes]